MRGLLGRLGRRRDFDRRELDGDEVFGIVAKGRDLRVLMSKTSSLKDLTGELRALAPPEHPARPENAPAS